jgi:hypothetical protein
MLKKHMATCLVATACAVAPALAQTSAPPPSGATDRPLATGSGSTTSGSPAMQPGPAGSPSTAGGTPPAASASPGASPAPSATGATSSPNAASSVQPGSESRFVTQLQQDQLLASKLIGTTVISASNEAIGDVNDVIIDRNGRALAIVIGVGGFLGIGEKDVAVQTSALEFTAGPGLTQSGSRENQQASTNPAAGASTRPATETTDSSVHTTGSASQQQNTATNRATATTGNTGNSGPNAGSSATGWMGMSGRGAPQRIVLRMTKSELEAAPAFRTRSRGDADSAAGSSSAPKQ